MIDDGLDGDESTEPEVILVLNCGIRLDEPGEDETRALRDERLTDVLRPLLDDIENT